MTTIPSAKEARGVTDKVVNNSIDDQRKKISDAIVQAAEKGEYTCNVGFIAHARLISQLKDLGYQVETHSDQRDGDVTLIGWKN